MKQMYGEAIRCEGLRAAVFAGRRTHMVFGQPDEWLALLIESMLRSGRGEDAAAEALRVQAFDAAPAGTGTLDGVPFRVARRRRHAARPGAGAYVNGRYYWVPFARLAHIRIDPPEDLRDCVWLPAHLAFENGGEALALIPTRYDGSQDSPVICNWPARPNGASCATACGSARGNGCCQPGRRPRPDGCARNPCSSPLRMGIPVRIRRRTEPWPNSTSRNACSPRCWTA